MAPVCCCWRRACGWGSGRYIAPPAPSLGLNRVRIRLCLLPRHQTAGGSESDDAFILARLREGRNPRRRDRRTLIRRCISTHRNAAFAGGRGSILRDRSADAWRRLVERLLDSPQYAEHWAQHWLDVVRFAESDGFEYDTHRSEAWRYRDYVIRSIREDKPYDRFLREQLAGDEMDSRDQEMQVAAGFHRLGALRKNAGNQDAAYNRNEVLVEMTNVIGSGLLGMTIGCARCHDHKFDPIRQKDYYRLRRFSLRPFRKTSRSRRRSSRRRGRRRRTPLRLN